MAGLYVHIPFCTSRCVYCGFYSTTSYAAQDRYIDCLCREMELRPHKTETINTVYIGGGTPSILTPRNIDRLLIYINKVYDVSADAEITIECNPDDVCKDGFYLPESINRVSMGAQTFSQKQLRFVNRRHTAQQVAIAVSRLRAMGIKNISIDLMFGFPDETMDDWQHDIDRALSLDVEHISAYSLMYEEGTPLFRMLEAGKIREIDEDLSVSMYDTMAKRLTDAGYDHYEISNFAKPGYRSRHNSSYWNETPYIGIGAAAHSYDKVTRRWNIADLQTYMDSIERGIVPCEVENIDANTRYDDLITTALRTKDGICLDTLSKQHRNYLLKNAESYIQQGFMLIENGRIRLTRDGIHISDRIMSDLMFV